MMGTYEQRKVSRGRRSARHGSGSLDTGAATDALVRLQRHADRSQPVQQLNTLQRDAVKSGAPDWAQEDYVNKVGKTGEVDTSSSAALPDYGPDEKPGWEKNDPTGVPAWAKEEYMKDAPRTLIASVADGKIGSIYFPDGRIRTTHSHGPTQSQHREALQYNIDYDAAEAEFEKKNRRLYHNLLTALERKHKRDPAVTQRMMKKAAAKEYYRAQSRYIAGRLNVTTPSNLPAFLRILTGARKLPSWAGDAIKSPDDAPDMETPTTGKLFEVFRDINGKVEGWHPSRGAAKKWATNKQVVSVLRAAIRHIQGVEGNGARNIAFYEFVLHRIPDFAAEIRRPDEI